MVTNNAHQKSVLPPKQSHDVCFDDVMMMKVLMCFLLTSVIFWQDPRNLLTCSPLISLCSGSFNNVSIEMHIKHVVLVTCTLAECQCDINIKPKESSIHLCTAQDLVLTPHS